MSTKQKEPTKQKESTNQKEMSDEKDIKEIDCFLWIIPMEFKKLSVIIGVDVFCFIWAYKNFILLPYLCFSNPLNWLYTICYIIRFTSIFYACNALQKKSTNLPILICYGLIATQLVVLIGKVNIMLFSNSWGGDWEAWFIPISSCILSPVELYMLLSFHFKIVKKKYKQEIKEKRKRQFRTIKDEDEDAENYDTYGLVSKIFEYFIPHKKPAILTFIGVVCSETLRCINPLVKAKMIDHLMALELVEFKKKMVFYCFLNAIQCCMHYVQAYYQRVIREAVTFDMKIDIFNAVMRCETGYFDENSTGEIQSDAIHHVNNASSWFTWQLRTIVELLVRSIVIISISFTIDIRIAICSLLVGPIFCCALRFFNSYSHIYYHHMLHEKRDNDKTLNEAISNIRTVKVFGAERFEFGQYFQSLESAWEILQTHIWYCETRWTICNLFPKFTEISVFYFGAQLVLAKQITIGELFAFVGYCGHMSWVFNSVSEQFQRLGSILVKANRVFRILDRNCELPRTGDVKPEKCEGRIEFKNVNFFYPTKKNEIVLKDLSLTIHSGETVALVGESGCGKSTIIKLISFLYGPAKGDGDVLLDGIPVADYNAKSFSNFVVSVPQEPVLFARSIRENIAYGFDASEDEIIQAAKNANAHEFIMKLDNGYNSVVGERGITLSGGQRQRVSIARALVRHPNVLLLDEATASLDSKSEHLVHNAIDQIIDGEDRTMSVVIVAHRLSTVKNANRIIVLKEGEIMEIGNHAELMKMGGHYSEFVVQQMLDTAKTKPEKTASVGEADNKLCVKKNSDVCKDKKAAAYVKKQQTQRIATAG